MISPKLFIFAFSLMPYTGFAAFLCPTNNFNQIDLGFTQDEVIKQCGKPPTVKQVSKPNDNVPQQWNYYITQNVAMNTTSMGQGTLQTSITFNEKGNAIFIGVNGIGVGATAICGRNIQLGESRQSIQSACGKPAFINKQQAGDVPTHIQQVQFIYGNQTLTFQDGKLISVQTQ